MDNKRGQLAVFIILAIVLVVVVLIVFLYPRVKPTTEETFTPTGYLRGCIEPEVRTSLQDIARQGGYANAEEHGSLLYQGEQIKYVCYTAEYYKTCIVQDPFIKERVERELADVITPQVQECVKELQREYERRGYSVSAASGGADVSFTPGKMTVAVNTPMTVSKENTQTFRGFGIELPSEMHDLLLTATSIISYESTYGDSETTLYLQYYPDLKIEKVKLSEGSKVYTLTNVVTNESFRFASRSLAWPAGYGLET